jgi:hypothetical protein
MTSRPDRIPFTSSRLRDETFGRGWACSLAAFVHGASAIEIAKENFPEPRTVVDYIKRGTATAATTSTVGWAAELGQTGLADFLINISGPTAGATLLKRGLQLSLGRNAAIRVPLRANDGTGAAFVAQGEPLPVKAFSISEGLLLGPKKLGLITVMTREIELYSVPALSTLVPQMVADGTANALDAIMFDDVVADSQRPAGLFAGANPALPATANVHDDLAALVSAVAPVSNGGPIVLVAAPGQAERLRCDRGVATNHEILSSVALPARTIAAIATNCLVSVSDPAPRYEVTTEALIHMDDVPLEIASTGAPNTVAAPTRSLYQQDCVGLRTIWGCNWGLRTKDAIAYMDAVTWGNQA